MLVGKGVTPDVAETPEPLLYCSSNIASDHWIVLSVPHLLLNILMPTLFLGFLFLNIFLVCISYFLFPPSPATEVIKENKTALKPLIHTMINSKYNKGIQASSVVLSLRLCGFLSQRQDQRLIEQFNLAMRNTGE